MKKLFFIFLAFVGVFLFASCEKFLTVTPKTEMPKDKLFSTEGGFKDALTGLYIQMNSSDAYGLAMTQTTVEQLIGSWDVVSGSTPQRIGLYNFADEGVLKSFESIYGKLYSIIASANSILEHIDANKGVFTNEELYKTIKSECLAIRAYCHLDILRLYGPVPSNPDEGNKFPYVTTVSKVPNSGISFDMYKQLLFKDLLEAEALIKDIDPITHYSMTQLKNPGINSGFNPDDTYIAYRGIRLNYYAIKGLEARAYMWFNEPEKAFESAKLVIEAKNEDGSNKFRLGTAADFTTANDYVLTNEHLFGLYDFNMFSKYSSTYAIGTIKKGTSATIITNQLYGNTGTDIREANLWELITLPNQARCYVIKKYKVAQNPTSIAVDYKQIPMLRLSEMYMIASEVAPLSEAQSYWTTFKQSRNIAITTLPSDPVARKFEILKEFRKEFYAEGQSFFAYKRLNAPKANVLFSPASAKLTYLFPMPRTESISSY